MSKLNERLDLLREEIQKDDFLDGKGLSNEVNIRIFCYPPEEEMALVGRLVCAAARDDFDSRVDDLRAQVTALTSRFPLYEG